MYTYLINKKRSHKFSWLEDVHDFPDEIVVGCLGEVGFETNVRELWLRGDVNRPVSSLFNSKEKSLISNSVMV